MSNISDADRLNEIREELAAVRLNRPAWPIKALFGALFKIIDILEEWRVNQAKIVDRLRLLEESKDERKRQSPASGE